MNRRFAALAFSICAALPAQSFAPDFWHELHWRCIGPFRGGRTRAIAGVPGEPSLFYMAQVDGGVWRSDDAGRTWSPIFDDQPTQSIGALAIAPSDPHVIYVSSGEGLARPDLSVGNGIYKSTDAGATWTHLGLRDGQQIPGLAVDPRDPNRVFAAVLGHPYGASSERGIYRSLDGGQTWQAVLHIDDNTGGFDVEIDASHPDTVYSTLWQVRQGPWEFGNKYSGLHGGIYKSEDGGTTWQKLGGGLPAEMTQAYVAISPSEPNRLYATVGGQHENGIYRSDDAGATWRRITKDKRPAIDTGGQGGDLPVPKVDPKNPDVLYTTSVVTWRSNDGGITWTALKGAPGGDDYQNLWINPNHPEIMLLASDQGAAVTLNGGRTWSSWYNQPTAQLYHVSASNGFPYRVCGGQQESGSVCTSSRGNDGEITFRDWHPAGVIEYGYAAPDPLDPDIIYGAGRGQVSKFHWSTGQVEMIAPTAVRDPTSFYRADRTQPILFSPLDPHVLYYANNVLFRSTDGGHSWQALSPDLTAAHPGIPASVGDAAAKDPKADQQRGVIYSIAPSFKSAGTIWVGTDDGQILVTRDGGHKWTNVTPPELTPWSKVTQLEASHFDDESAYASVSRFRVNDMRPYIYRTRDGGKTWQPIVGGLAEDAPVDVVREDPVRKGLLFAGSETTVSVSFDDGDHWQPLQLNLPHTSMRDLIVHGNDLIVATHGRSFWILDDITPLRQASDEKLRAAAWLSRPAPAIRARRDTNTDTPLPPDEPAGENPPAGAIIDYYLSQAATGPVTLEILNDRGDLVRRYSSADEPEVTRASLEKLTIPAYWVRMPRTLPADAGLHRWVWDLHYTAPDSLRHEYPISAIPHDTPREPKGPLALPGSYTVRLTVNGTQYTAPLTVTMDPRVKTSMADLRKMFEFEMQLSPMVSRGTQAIREARAAKEQLEKLKPQLTAEVAESAEATAKKVGALMAPGAEGTITGVTSEAAMLYGGIGGADAAPTEAQTAGVATVSREFPGVMARWDELKSHDFAELNARLRAAGKPEIRLDTSAREADEEGAADVEDE